MERRPIHPPVLRVDRRAWWPSTIYAKIYAREEHVVDWSSVGTHEEGLELRYGPRKDWQAMDDAHCEQSGVPMIFRWGGPSAFYASDDKRSVERPRKNNIFECSQEETSRVQALVQEWDVWQNKM